MAERRQVGATHAWNEYGEGAMRRLDVRDVLAILFVLIGAIPIVLWLGSWLYHSMTFDHLVQGALIVIVLTLAWWMRKRFEKK